jgi:Amt family ammonium transporter
MQAGFSYIESGSSRMRSSTNIMIKDMLSCVFAALGWYLLGYEFAYGDSSNGFIGYNNFVENGFKDSSRDYYLNWFFQFMF